MHDQVPLQAAPAADSHSPPAPQAPHSLADDARTIAAEFQPPPHHRRLYCNRTLNLRAIKAVGYDMDYTLIHYKVSEWEGRAYVHLRQRLLDQGWPVKQLEFDGERVMRGLVIDKQHGNIVKANRFGYVKSALHGARFLEVEEVRKTYGATLVDLADTSRWVFLNTLFEISEGCMYAQLVDMLDRRELPEVLGYDALYRRVRHTLDRAHVEGELKAEILAHPDRFVDRDADLPQTLLDQRDSGKKLLLITNSEWSYTNAMMAYAFDRFLPAGQTWRDLFSVVVVSSRKPAFFHNTQGVMLELVDEARGLLKPVDGLREGAVYFGGAADRVEKLLGLDGDQILYVGDHMLADVHQSKKSLQWRTAMILRELEDELEAVAAWRGNQQRIEALMAEKERLEFAFSQLRVRRQREKAGSSARQTGNNGNGKTSERMNTLRERLLELDNTIGPLVAQQGQIHNRYWGLMLRAGNDKSLFARQIESHADVYTSRVSNFLHETPFVFLRSARGVLPHDHAL